MEKYLSEGVEKVRADFNILSWWKVNSPRFPILAEIARDVLASPISSVASECAFSTGGRILDSFRSSLTPKLVEALVCLQDWLRSESLPVSVEEDLDNLEKLEEDFSKLGKELCIDELYIVVSWNRGKKGLTMPGLVVRRRRIRHSSVWLYFEITELGAIDWLEVKCIYCGKVYRQDPETGTSTLLRHVMRCLGCMEHARRIGHPI